MLARCSIPSRGSLLLAALITADCIAMVAVFAAVSPDSLDFTHDGAAP